MFLKSRKIILVLSMFLLSLTFVFAEKAAFEGEDYSLFVEYNESAFPGDAVFLKMTFTQTSRRTHISKEQFAQTTGVMELKNGDTVLRKSNFYALPAERSSRVELKLMTGIPLSSWWTADELTNLSLQITYNLYGNTPLAFSVPFKLNPKEFESETIPLNETNTAIRTDTSPQRVTQIERLNEILATVNSDAVYALQTYKAPTTVTRRTSFFADRRVYAYSNGKTATSLHYGIDYGAGTGTPVMACAQGKVVLAEFRNSTGWSVVIEHLPGLYSLYYHMSELSVKEGEMVTLGQQVGLSGATGLATGPHIHWEMRLNGEAVSPDFFTQDFTFSEE